MVRKKPDDPGSEAPEPSAVPGPEQPAGEISDAELGDEIIERLNDAQNLEDYYLDKADEEGERIEGLDAARNALEGGNIKTARLLVAADSLVEEERNQPRGKLLELSVAREKYMAQLAIKQPVTPKAHEQYKTDLAVVEGHYHEAFVGRIADVLDMHATDEDAPYAEPQMVGFHKSELSHQDLSGFHVHLLLDELTREEELMEETIEANSDLRIKKMVKMFQKPRVRLVVGTALFGAGAFLKFNNSLPIEAQEVGDVVGPALQLLGGYLDARGLYDSAANRIGRIHRARIRGKEIKEISASRFKSDMVLRTIYGDKEYVADKEDRVARNEPEENQALFDRVPDELRQISQARAKGAPDTAMTESILNNAIRLHMQYEKEIKAILTPDPNKAFLELAMIIIKDRTADFDREVQKDKVKVGTAWIGRCIGVVGPDIIEIYETGEDIVENMGKVAKEDTES